MPNTNGDLAEVKQMLAKAEKRAEYQYVLTVALTAVIVALAVVNYTKLGALILFGVGFVAMIVYSLKFRRVSKRS